MAPGDQDATTPPQAQSLLSGVKGWMYDGLELLRVRLELIGLEAGHHARSLAEMVAWAVASAFFLCLGLGFVAILLTVLLWDSHRTLVLGLFSAVFITLGGVAFWILRSKLNENRRWFEATAQELASDAQQLKP